MSGKIGSITTDIIRNGLEFNVDPANRASYIPNSTQFNNTLDSSQTGSFVNETSFLSPPISASCFSFDGVDDYTRTPIPVETYKTSTIRTFGFWAKINTLNTYTPLLGGIGMNNLFRYANNFGFKSNKLYWVLEGLAANTSGCWARSSDDLDSIVGDGNWHYYAFFNPVTHNDVDRANIANCKIWLDGSPLSMYINQGTSIVIRGFTGGALVEGAGNSGSSTGQQYLHGEIANIHYYPRELSDNEVLHNYNALKGRFGL